MDFCTPPPLPASARALSSFFPLTNGNTQLGSIEFPYAVMRAFGKLSMAIGGGFAFPRANRTPLGGGTITTLTATTLTDSSATFTGTFKRCGKTTSLVGARVRIYIKDDPRYVATSKVKAIVDAHNITLGATDFVARGQCANLSDCNGLSYTIWAPVDIDSYDRWPDPPNAMEYVAQYQLAREAFVAGSNTGNFAQKLIVFTGTPTSGSYSFHTGGSDTSAIAFNATATDIASAISAGVGGGVAVIAYQNGFAVAFAPGVSNTLTVASSTTLVGGSVAVTAAPAGTLIDPRMVYAGGADTRASGSDDPTGQFTTAQPHFPDKPTSFVLVVQDSGGPAVAATATAMVTPTGGLSLGQVANAAMSAGGSGYTSAPTVTFSGGGGTGATGTATVATGSTGTLSAVNVTNGGFGYTSPSVAVTGGGGTGATVTATVGAGGGITGFTVTNGGFGYTSTPTLTIVGSTGTGAAGLAILAGGISGITITARGSGYTSPPTVALTGGGGSGAAAKASLASGPITKITVATGGSGYNSAPLIVISSTGIGDGGGSASFPGTVSGSIPTGNNPPNTDISIDSGGHYTVTPTIQFTGGGGDMLVRRFPITANTGTAGTPGGTITVGSLGSWTPSLNLYYSVIAHDPADGNSIWNPQAKAWARQVAYSGARTTEVGRSHFPDGSIRNYPQWAVVVYYDGGNTAGGLVDCEGSTPFLALDVDVWNDCCEDDCCSEADRPYSPDYWKSPRAWLNAITGFGAPWIVPGYSGGAAQPDWWNFPEIMAGLGFNAGSTSISFVGGDFSKAYIGVTLPVNSDGTPAYGTANLPVIWWTLINPSPTGGSSRIVGSSSTQVGQDVHGVYIPGSWDSSQSGWQLFWAWGIDAPSMQAFRRMSDVSTWIPDIVTGEDGGETVVDPPGVSDSDTPATVTASVSGGVVTGFTVTGGGADYTSVPTVEIIGGGGFGSRGLAHISGGAVSSVTVVAGGSGYTGPPTVNLHGGGPVLIGSFSGDLASTNYLDFGGVGTGESGPAFAAGHIAEYQADQAFQQTMPELLADGSDPTEQYVDRKWVGTNGAAPPNIAYAGKVVRSTDPTSPDYLLYDSTGKDSLGTGQPWAQGTVKSFGNTGGKTSQITFDGLGGSGMWSFCYSSDSAGITVTGTVTSATATSVTDTGSTFDLRAWGRVVAIVHGSGPTATTYTGTINGVSSDGHTLTSTGGLTPAYTPVAGDTIAFVLPGGSLQVNQGSVALKMIQGIVTTGGTTSMIDSAFANSPWLRSDYWPGNAVLEVFHNAGGGAQTRSKFWINGTVQSTGEIDVDAVDSQTIAAGDLWMVRVTSSPMRLSGVWLTATPPATTDIGDGVGKPRDVKLRGGDFETVFLASPPSAFALPAGAVTNYKLSLFNPGAVLIRKGDDGVSAGNTRWVAPTGTDPRVDHHTGGHPTFKVPLWCNATGIRNTKGRLLPWTYESVPMWNQWWAVIKTLTQTLGDPSCFSNGDDNAIHFSGAGEPGSGFNIIYGTDNSPPDPVTEDDAWGVLTGRIDSAWPPGTFNVEQCPQALVTVGSSSPWEGDTRFADASVFVNDIGWNYSYARDDNIPICPSPPTVDFYMYSQVDSIDTPVGLVSDWPDHQEAIFDPQGGPFVYHQYAKVDSVVASGSSAIGVDPIGPTSTTLPSLIEPPDPIAHSGPGPFPADTAGAGSESGFYVSATICIRNWSLTL